MRIALATVLLGTARLASAEPLDVDACVDRALRQGAEVRIAEADLSRLKAEAREVSALLSPKVTGTALAAPMFGASGGLGFETPYTRDLSSWGPYLHADAQVIKPLSTFGRYTAGVEAATERARLEEAKVREVQDGVAVEVRRMYGLRLYAGHLRTALSGAHGLLSGALERAEELYDAGSGEVTLPDVMKLRYGVLELQRLGRLAGDGEELAGRALRHAMGLPDDADVTFAEQRLTAPADEPTSLEALLEEALSQRPEFAQIAHGRKAAAALEKAERLALAPVLFVAATGAADWSPARPRGYSATFLNTFNDYFGGVGLGLRFDIDAGKRSAKIEQAEALAQKAEASEALARTGIPLQIFKARQELVQNIELARVANQQVVATRRWMTSAGAAYESGTGEARDVLEGVVAYLQARRTYYDHALGAWVADAELRRAVGRR